MYLNLDEVIRIIREEEDAAASLCQRFGLSARQAQAILETKLRHLAKLEETMLQAEATKLGAERMSLETYLGSESALRGLLKTEIREDMKNYGDKRRAKLVEREAAQVLAIEESIPNEWLTIVMSQQAWVRAAKGLEIKGEGLPFKAGDGFLMQVTAKSTQQLNVFDSQGRIYQLPAYGLPSARGQGEPLTSRLQLAPGAKFIGLGVIEPNGHYVLLNQGGFGFCLPYAGAQTKNRSGKLCMNLPEGVSMLPPLNCGGNMEEKYLALLNSQGRLLIIPLSELPVLQKGRGNTLMKCKSLIAGEEIRLLSAQLLTAQQSLKIDAVKHQQTLTFTQWKQYIGKRGQTGKTLTRNLLKAFALAVEDAKR